jgi:hypothetical protein
MRLNGEQVELMRGNAYILLDMILPFKTGDEKFNVVCKDYSNGTTCGFLCHWLLWRLGVKGDTNYSYIAEKKGTERMRPTVNRKEPGFRYSDGDNISCIYYSPKFRKAAGPRDTAIQTGKRPQKGDIVYIYQTEPMGDGTDHVFCFLREEKDGTWITAEAGQYKGEWGNIVTNRRLVLGKPPKVAGNSPNRTLIGWLPLDELDFGPPPLPLFPPFL